MVHGLLFYIIDNYGWIGGARSNLGSLVIIVPVRLVRMHNRDVGERSLTKRDARRDYR